MESKISFQVSKNELQKHLTKVSKAVRDKATLPIYTMFLFEILGEELKLTGTDTEMQIESTLPILDTSGELSFCVDKSIMDILKTLAEQPLTIDASIIKVSDTLNRVEIDIIHSSGNVVIPGDESVSFTKMKDVTGKSFDIEVSKLKRGLDKTQKFSYGATDKPAINTVYFDIGPDSLTFASTDSFIVSRFVDSSIKITDVGSFLLRLESAVILSSLIDAMTEGEIKIIANPNNVSFEISELRFTSRLTEASFVNYKRLFETSNPISMKTETKLLSNVINRILSVSSKDSCLIRLESGLLQTQLSAKNEMLNKSAVDSINSEGMGEIVIGLHGRRLLAMTSVIDTPTTVISFLAPDKPIIVTPEVQIEGCMHQMLMMAMILPN